MFTRQSTDQSAFPEGRSAGVARESGLGVDVVIVRHADAEPDSGQGDAARRLTPLGVEQALATAAALKKQGIQPGAVFSSPYVRAMQTAKPIAEAFELSVTATLELASGRLDPRSLMTFLAAQELACAIVVGHMPDVAELQGYLAGGRVEGFDKAEWRVVATIVEVD